MAIARPFHGLALAAGLFVVTAGVRAQIAPAPVDFPGAIPVMAAPIVLGESAPFLPGAVIDGGTVLGPAWVAALAPQGGGAGQADSSVRGRPPGDLLWKTLHDRGWEALRGIVPNDEEMTSRLDVADNLFRAALERLQPYRAGDGRVATTYQDLAWVFFLRTRYDDARSLASWALDERTARLGPYNAETGDSLVLMAKIAAAQGRHAEAEGFAQRALAAFTRSSPGPQLDLHTPVALDVLSTIQAARSKLDTAVAYARQALDWRQDVFDSELYPPDRHVQVVVELSRSYNSLATLLRKVGREEVAAILEDQARFILESAAGSPSEPMAPPAPVPGG